MNSMTTEQLLMCEKADLVKYIEELKGEVEGWKASRDDDIREAQGSMRDELEELHKDINAISYEFMSGDDTLEDIHGFIEQKTDEIVELREELEELKASEALASHVAEVNAGDIEELQKEVKELKQDLKFQHTTIHAQNRAEVSEEKKYSTEQRERADKYMEEIEKLKKENQEQYAEWVKVKNACELYKGFMAHHVSEQIEHDMEDRCFGQVDISAGKWLSKFLQEKFYEEIIPVIIDEITDDNVYSSEVSLDHIGNGCISYTYLEDIQEE